MIKPLLFILMAIMAFAPAEAVLKEKNLSKTLKVLYAELEANYQKQKAVMATAEKRMQNRHNELISLMQRSQQISLMLYSQPKDYVFDITYTAEQAIDLYNEFNENMKNSETSFNYSVRLFEEVNRYDGLIRALECLPPTINQPKSELEELVAKEAAANDSIAAANDSIAAANDSIAAANDSVVAANVSTAIKEKIDELKEEMQDEHPYMLTEEEQKMRETCVIYAKALRNNYVRLYNRTKEDERHYKEVSDRLTELNEYAQLQYQKLSRSLTENGGDDYFKILSKLPSRLKQGKTNIKEKYSRLHANSDWRGPVIIFVSILIILYMAIASAVSYMLIVLLPKMPNRPGRYIREHRVYQDKKVMISYAFGVAIFGAAIGLVKFFVTDNHLVIMATTFMYDFAWLLFVNILSLTIRHSGDRLHHSFMSYIPFLFVAFFVIIMRIVFMPTSIINLVFPPVMLVFTIWQIFNLRKRRKHLATSDMIFAHISLMAMIIATITSWAGYTLAGVETIVWWSYQLAFIQTIECIRDIAGNYEKNTFLARIRAKHHIPASTSDTQLWNQMRKGDFIGATWLYDFIRVALIPILAIFSVLASIVLEAEFFNLSGACKEYFETDFVNIPDVIQVSLYKLYQAGVMLFVFRYLLYVVRSAYRVAKERHSAKHKLPQANITLANNLLAILVWGFYFIFCLVLFNVPKSGISVISAGLATGLGFAMKDLLENFFYGISLMAGRVRVGDFIECDGTFGRVESITYQSTQISTLDGGTVAFLNTSLFSKNFRNLTRTGNYAFVKIPIGVAYGSNIDHVRKTLIDNLNTFYTEFKASHTNLRRPALNESGFSVLFNDFGDSSVDLIVTYWVLVEQRWMFNALVKEQIYKVLTEAGIEIPFPQRDIHIIKSAEEK